MLMDRHALCRGCQKKDWSTHKVHCGKEKTAKMLRGTIHDPFWQVPDAPAHLLNINFNSSGNIPASEVGFSHPAYADNYSNALRLQTAFLDRERRVDYCLFDERGQPVRFEISEWDTPHKKLAFRLFRAEAFTYSPPKKPGAIEAMAEHLIMYAAQMPGLSRDRILAQLSLEYRMDVKKALVFFNLFPPGEPARLPSESFVDYLGRSVITTTRILDNIGPSFS